MKLHGKTTIELHDIKRNIKQIIRSENTFQASALADYFQTFGEEDSNPFRSGSFDSKDLWKNAVGGIFLLKNPETVGNKFMSAGNKMVGNGAYGISNNAAPTELGSYNSIESSESGDAITQVYDFTTAQANDRICCVCLTSRVGGYIGYGNVASQQYHSSRSFGLESNQNYRGVVNFNIASAHGDWVIAPSPDYSDGKIKIVKTRRSLITGSVFNGYSKELEFDLSTVGDAYNLSGTTHTYPCDKVFDIGNGIFRWIPCVSSKTVAPNGTVYYYEFDAVNETLTQKSFTNSSSNTIIASQETFTEVTHVYFLGKYALATVGEPTQGNGYILEVFDVTNNIHMKSLNIHSIVGNGTAFRRQWSIPLGDALFMFKGSGSGVYYIYDIEADTVAPVNANSGNSEWSWVRNPSLNSGALVREGVSVGTSYYTNGAIHNPLYLATINNLDPYVTKTAAQTMKVTYTLTEA